MEAQNIFQENSDTASEVQKIKVSRREMPKSPLLCTLCEIVSRDIDIQK
jgi:hypothetical protein